MARLPLVSPLERILFLKAQDYLEGQPPSLLTVLASYSEDRFYPAGTIVRGAGEPIERIIFLAQGSLRVGADATTEGQSVEAPGVIGLAHHLAGADSPPAVIAATDTLCLEVSTTDLDQILEDHFSLLLQFAQRGCSEALRVYRRLGDARPAEPGFDGEPATSTPVEVNLVERLARIRHAPFLRGTNLTVLGQMIRTEEPRIIAAGESIWRAGEEVDALAVVLDGVLRSDGKYGHVTAPSGATLGVLEILSPRPRFEGWIAETPSRVLTIRRELFTDLLEDHFDFALAYLRRTAQQTLTAWQLDAEKNGHA